jgi:oxygen-dependent protoporphyrinogen oxidase
VRRLVVIGGGISGLAAAWAGRAARKPTGGLEITVLESGPDVGGAAQSIARDGWLAEAGPNGFLSGSPAIDRLIDAADLKDQLLPANTAAARRYIYWRGRIRRVTPNPFGLMRAGLLSPVGALRLLLELGVSRRPGADDESIDEFVVRRFGAEAAERLARPMTLGVFAGDARALSLPAAFPQLAALERDYGSVIRGMVARRGSGQRGKLTSFAGGMAVLPRELARRGRFDVSCNAPVNAISTADGQWRVHVTGREAPLAADAVVVATGARAASQLIRSIDPGAAAELAAIEAPAVSVVALGYGPEASPRIPVGFGVLIARDNGFRTLGNLWESQIFPGRAPAGHTLIRVLYGGGADPAAGALDHDELATLARAEVRRLYGLEHDPIFEEVIRWPQAIPQYTIGHGARVARIGQAMASHPGLFIAGAALRGVALPAAAAAGMEAGERAAALLASEPSRG